MEWRSCFPGCWGSFRLLLCLETLWFLPMEMQTTITISRLSCGGRGSYYTYARFLVMGNGDGDNGDVILILGPAAGSIITDNRAEFRNGNGDGEGFSCLVSCTSSWYYCCGASGFGNGEWRRISATCVQS